MAVAATLPELSEWTVIKVCKKYSICEKTILDKVIMITESPTAHY